MAQSEPPNECGFDSLGGESKDPEKAQRISAALGSSPQMFRRQPLQKAQRLRVSLIQSFKHNVSVDQLHTAGGTRRVLSG